MFGWMKKLWSNIVTYFRPNGRHATAPPIPPPFSVAEPARPEESGEPDQRPSFDAVDQAPTSLNRRDRRRLSALHRKYERARMKHDEWVTPQGPEPVKIEHSPHKPYEHQGLEEDEFVDPYQKYIVGEWNEGDGKEKVLFEESEFYGTFNFRDTILKQLDRYWVYVERMKRHDPDAYGFYKQLGATSVPYISTGTNLKHDYNKKVEDIEKFKSEIVLPAWFKQHWPTFGCLCIGINPLDEEREKKDLGGDLWAPKFAYFVRLGKIPWYIQPMRGGKLYLLTIWWDRPDHPKSRNKWGIPNTFPIWISDDGNTIRALKTRETSSGRIRAEHDWHIPYGYKEWAKQYGLTAQLHLTHLFCRVARDIEETYYSTCRVEVNKGDLTAVFGIEPHRVPYFFKDRDVTLTKHGHKERVFHVVRAHIRNGKAVPIQYRGLKEFEWAGYHVSITIPGRDHFLLQEFNVPSIVTPNRYRKKGYQSEPEIATWLKRKLKTGWGGYAHS